MKFSHFGVRSVFVLMIFAQMLFSCSSTNLQSDKLNFEASKELAIVQANVPGFKPGNTTENEKFGTNKTENKNTFSLKEEIATASTNNNSIVKLQKHVSANSMFHKQNGNIKKSFTTLPEKHWLRSYKYTPKSGNKYASSSGMSTLAIIAFALSVVSLILMFVPVGVLALLSFFGAIASFVLGIVSLNNIKKNGETGMGFAIAAIVISALIILLILLVILFIVAYFAGG